MAAEIGVIDQQEINGREAFRMFYIYRNIAILDANGVKVVVTPSLTLSPELVNPTGGLLTAAEITDIDNGDAAVEEPPIVKRKPGESNAALLGRVLTDYDVRKAAFIAQKTAQHQFTGLRVNANP